MFAAAALQTARRPAGGNLECAGETMRNGQMDAALMVVAAFALVSVLAAPARAVDDARGRGPAFVDAFREAYDGKDLGAALNLFCWRGINAAKRRAIVGLVERDLAGTLVGTRMLDADARPTTFIIDARAGPTPPSSATCSPSSRSPEAAATFRFIFWANATAGAASPLPFPTSKSEASERHFRIQRLGRALDLREGKQAVVRAGEADAVAFDDQL